MISKEIKLSCWDEHDHEPDYAKILLTTTGKFCNKFVYNLSDSKIDVAKSYSALKSIYKEAEISCTYGYNQPSENKEDEEELESIDNAHLYEDFNVTIITNEFILFIVSYQVILYYTMDIIPENFIEELLKSLVLKDNSPVSLEIDLVCYGSTFYTDTNTINKVSVNLDMDYNDSIKDLESIMKEKMDSKESGLFILHGEPGTGKTYYIRHLITDYPHHYLFIPSTLANNLAEPAFLSFLLKQKDSIFILEDCEQVLKNRDENMYSSAISAILNIADGLLSDILNIKLICTFNSEIKNIDPAVLRKGRCFVNYEFTKLNKEKTKRLLNSRDIILDEYKEMTLSEIYNYNKDLLDKKVQTKKIGF